MLKQAGARALGAKDESGSVIIAMLVVMIVTFAIAGVLLAVSGSQELTRTDQNRTNAFQFANAGVDHAMYRLDTGTLPLVPSADGFQYVPTVNGAGEVTGFSEKVTINGSRFDVRADESPAGQPAIWKVMATGTDRVSGRLRRAIATVQATPLFREGFFTDENFTLTGNQTTPIAYDSSDPACEDPRGKSACDLVPVPGRLGTNATIDGATATVQTFIARWQGFDMYGRATQQAADLACDVGNCGTAPVVQAITTRRDLTLDWGTGVPAGAQPCPAAANAPGGGLIVGGSPPINYTCSAVNFSGNVTVTGGVAVIWVDGNVSVAAGGIVNQGKRATNLQIMQNPNTTSGTGGSICDGEIWAITYAPRLSVDCTGSHQPIMYGSVIAKLHGGTGDHFDFHWDISARYARTDGKFVIKNWRECPPTVSDC